MTIATDPDQRTKRGRAPRPPGIRERVLPTLTRLLGALRSRERSAAWFERQFETETAARSGFHLIPIGLMAGIALTDGAGWYLPWPVTAALAVAAVLLVRICSGRPVMRAVVLFAGCCALGMTLAASEIARTRTTIFSGEATVRIHGTVVERERDERGRFRYLVDIASTERPTLSRPPERVRLVIGSRHAPIPIGGSYDGLVRLRPPSGPAMPGAYDFAFSQYFEGVGAFGFGLGAPDVRTPLAVHEERGWLTGVDRGLAAIRLSMTERIRAAIGGAEGAIAAALITGERGGLPDEEQEWLRGTGLAHVLSISGLHMAIVAGFAMLLVRSSLAAVPAVALALPVKKTAAVVALVIAAFYLGISGANVATQRAFVMLAIMLTAVMLDRPALTLRNVSIAAIVVIALSPHSVLTASFQMSFAATVALIGGYAILSRRRPAWAPIRPSLSRRLVAGLLAIALTSLIAGSATGPFSVYHFNRLAPFGFVANVLTMPLFTLWIMPLALLGCLLMPFGLDAVPLQAMGKGIEVVLKVAETVYSHLPDQAIGSTTAAGLVFLTAAILAAACFASAFRWMALPLLLSGLFLSIDRRPSPSLLVFEDGKQVAVVSPAEKGGPTLAFLTARPNDFVASQWERALGISSMANHRRSSRVAIEKQCDRDLCLFETGDGIRVAYTENYERTGDACDRADIAIVARAIRLAGCRSGAVLVTLRTLRRTGSLSIRRDVSDGSLSVERSIPERPEPWNRHRLASWPEYWRKPEMQASIGEVLETATEDRTDHRW